MVMLNDDNNYRQHPLIPNPIYLKQGNLAPSVDTPSAVARK